MRVNNFYEIISLTEGHRGTAIIRANDEDEALNAFMEFKYDYADDEDKAEYKKDYRAVRLDIPQNNRPIVITSYWE